MEMSTDVREQYEVIEEFQGSPVVRLFRAVDRETGERVLVRELVVPPNVTAEAAEEIAESFRTRAAQLAGLTGPHLSRVIRTETDQGVSREVFASPEGRPLSSLIAGGERLSPVRAARVCRDVAAAAALLCSQGIPVGAVSPADVFISQNDEVTFVDSGILSPEAAAAVWEAGVVPFDYRFAAPEMLQGAEPTEAGAAYSVGALLSRLIAGRQPVEGATPVALAEGIRAASTPSVNTGDEELDEALNAILGSALSADPASRQPLSGLVEQLSQVAGTQEPQLAVLPAAEPVAAPEPRQRRGFPAWAAVGLVVVAVAMAVVVFGPWGKPLPAEEPAVTLTTRQPQPVRSGVAPRQVNPPRPTQPPPTAAGTRTPTPTQAPQLRVAQPAPAPRPAREPQVYGDPTPRQWATVHVRCAAPDARVYLDGVYAGVAPTSMQHVSPGEHTLSVQAKGYREWSADITAIPDQPVTVIANLTLQ